MGYVAPRKPSQADGLEDFISDMLKSGEYHDRDDLVRAALTALQDQRAEDENVKQSFESLPLASAFLASKESGLSACLDDSAAGVHDASRAATA